MEKDEDADLNVRHDFGTEDVMTGGPIPLPLPEGRIEVRGRRALNRVLHT
jgi:hypothetical protein